MNAASFATLRLLAPLRALQLALAASFLALQIIILVRLTYTNVAVPAHRPWGTGAARLVTLRQYASRDIYTTFAGAWALAHALFSRRALPRLLLRRPLFPPSVCSLVWEGLTLLVWLPAAVLVAVDARTRKGPLRAHTVACAVLAGVACAAFVASLAVVGVMRRMPPSASTVHRGDTGGKDEDIESKVPESPKNQTEKDDDETIYDLSEHAR